MNEFRDFSNNITSAVVAGQLPQFIREDYQNYVAFIEAYYEFLELPGNAENAIKNIPNYMDVDYVVSNDLLQFVEYFRQTYLVNIPTTVLADKAKLIQHIKQFYTTKGTAKAFKFLFRILYNEDVDVFNTGTQVLKLSAGQWFQPQVLRIASNSPNLTDWIGLQITGNVSFASAVVEDATYDQQNGVLYQELQLSNVTQPFKVGEQISGNNGTSTISGTIFGVLTAINVVNKGSLYNVGDPVIITGGGGSNANAIISSISPGSLQQVGIISGGAGFQTYPEYIVNIENSLTPVLGIISNVDSSGDLSPNQYIINDDLLINSLNVSLNSTFTNFTTSNVTVNSVMNQAFQYAVYGNCGPITFISIIDGGSFEKAPNVSITQATTIGNANTQLVSLGIIGSFEIINGGIGYSVNDAIKVINTISNGTGCEGYVTSVAANGQITGTYVTNPSISGTANVKYNSNVVIGTNTSFSTQLLANTYGNGSYIIVNGELHRVNTIANNNYLTVSVNFQSNANNSFIRLYGYQPGGFGYKTNDIVYNGLYTSVISTSGGTGAHIIPNTLVGDSFVFNVISGTYGQVETIQVNDVGQGFLTTPTIDLTQSGDGTATAVAQAIVGLFTYPGRYLNEDGMLSSRRYIQDAFQYNNYSYLLRSEVATTLYRDLVYKILNPSGMNMITITEQNVNPEPIGIINIPVTTMTSVEGLILLGFNFITSNSAPS